MIAKNKKSTSISERIQTLIEDMGMNNNQFSKKIGLGNNVTIGRIINETRKPSYDVLERILQTFGNINADWLMKGEGEMYTDNVHSQVHSNKKRGEEKRGDLWGGVGGSQKGTALVSTPFTPDGEGVPYYEIDVSASPIEMFSDDPEIPALKLVVPGFEDCDMAVNVWGDSMLPAYNSGDIIICKRIHDKSEIVYGEPYLLITPERRLLKYVKRSKIKGCWLLVSENKFYDPFEVEVDKVLHLLLVKGKVKRNSL